MMEKEKMKESEAVKLVKSDLSQIPDRFQGGEERRLSMGWDWFFYQPSPDEPPIHYMREFFPNRFSSVCGLIRLGSTPYEKNSVLNETLQMAKDVSANYCFDPDGTYDYMQKTADGSVEIRYSEKGALIREKDVFELKYEYFPYALILNENGILDAPYIHQHALISGTYKGKEVQMLGGWDRVFADTGNPNDKYKYAESSGIKSTEEGILYIGAILEGIREDGRKESAVAYIDGGRTVGYYYIDGEEPVLSSDVSLKTTWKPVPYLAGRRRYIYEDAVFSFAGKEIHVSPKWGWNGNNNDYQDTFHTQCSGTWYAGEKPYTHKLQLTFGECHHAYLENLKEAGFTIS